MTTLINQRSQPAGRQAAPTPSLAIGSLEFGCHCFRSIFNSHIIILFFRCFIFFTLGTVFDGLQILGSNTESLHLGPDVQHRFVKLPRFDVGRLFLQFFNLKLNIY